MNSTRYVFISGGVLSGLGKGVCAASLGTLLKNRGYKVKPIKCENYLNIDSGTINPIEHGDPFLCADGLEADMDLGTYERFLGEEMGCKNFTTMGQIYQTVINKERSMGYNGEDVEAIPHVSNEIIKRITSVSDGNDFVIVELGGTTGEYQNMLYYEACRIMRAKMDGRIVNVHVSYVPLPKHIGEPKTMPTQMSVRTLMSLGIQPEYLILRSEIEMDKRRRYILGLKTSVPGENVILARDLENIYELPIEFLKQEFDKKIIKFFNLPVKRINISPWQRMLKKINKKKNKKVNIAIVGKYFSKNEGDFQLYDAYCALIEAIKHACWNLEVGLELNLINTDKIEKDGIKSLQKSNGIIVPIGWGKRGVEGKIKTINYARENKIPYVGLCYGMQLACIEFARNVIGWRDAHTKEVNEKTRHPVIHDIPLDEKYQKIKGDGTSMRLGSYDCILKPKTLLYDIYKKNRKGRKYNKNKLLVSERHRHRYEFNNKYRKDFEKHGFVFSGTSPDNFFVEMVELPKKVHPFFVGTQGHPEYKSTPLKPHPIFLEFIKASLKKML